MKKLIIAAVALTIGAGTAGYAVGQSKTKSPADQWWEQVVMAQAEGGYENYQKLSSLYTQAAGNKDMTKRILQQGMQSRGSGNSDPIPLLVLQTAQNQRIIELLEAQAKKK